MSSAGLVPVRSSHFVNSPIRTRCSTGMLLTETVTVSIGRPMPATHSLPCSCLRPSATASKSVAAVTSTVWATPSMSAIVTRQDRISIARKYHIRFLFAIWFWATFAPEGDCRVADRYVHYGLRETPNWIPRENASAPAPFPELAHLYYHCCDKRFGANRSKKRGNDDERDG